MTLYHGSLPDKVDAVTEAEGFGEEKENADRDLDREMIECARCAGDTAATTGDF